MWPRFDNRWINRLCKATAAQARALQGLLFYHWIFLILADPFWLAIVERFLSISFRELTERRTLFMILSFVNYIPADERPLIRLRIPFKFLDIYYSFIVTIVLIENESTWRILKLKLSHLFSFILFNFHFRIF